MLGRALIRTSSLANDVTLDFHPTDGLSVQQCHSTGVAAAHLRVPCAAFMVFEIDRPKTFVLFYETVKSFAAACKVSYTATFLETAERPDVLRVRLYSADSERMLTFKLKDPESAPEVPHFAYDVAQYSAMARLSSKQFAEEIQLCDQQKANVVQFLADVNRLVIVSYADMSASSSEVCESVVAVDELRVDGTVHDQKFLVEFLKLISTFKDVGRSVTLHFGSDTAPLWLQFSVDVSSGAAAAAAKNGEQQQRTSSVFGEINVLLSDRIQQ